MNEYTEVTVGFQSRDNVVYIVKGWTRSGVAITFCGESVGRGARQGEIAIHLFCWALRRPDVAVVPSNEVMKNWMLLNF